MPKIPLHSLEFRSEAVRLLRSSGRSIPQLAHEFGVSPQSLPNWSVQLDVDEGKAERPNSSERDELRRLRRENRVLAEEREILKKRRPSSPRRVGPGEDVSVHRRGEGLGIPARPNFSIEVMFRPVAGVERAWSMAFEHGVHDVKLGDLLGRSSPALQGAILKTYSDSFKLVRPYKCKAKICVGEFAQRTASLHIGFGTQPTLDTWLTVWQAPTD